MNINREELAWAAGFFDGEGCFRLHSKSKDASYYYAACTINQIHPEVLHRFKDAVQGLGSVTGPHEKGNKRQPLYNYQCTNFAGVQAIYAMLYPFLGSVKREQGKNVLLKCKRPSFSKDVCRNGHLKTPENLTKYNQCRECMRESDRKRR